ncbi:dual specificity testis-specific protein kinase 1-like isoform X2 [Pseudoliparis swirei]|uniref:dual specificity testis-specific protein kinase 1-like isoform X2 n=1 Tax=Pseudoliparis swirei TaxID=2059687 RepID=UPI0024BDCFEC|nr:dual specificity testis-specific protein kinase 1-like isoform X2 [Pseudoliparis swirei]
MWLDMYLEHPSVLFIYVTCSRCNKYKYYIFSNTSSGFSLVGSKSQLRFYDVENTTHSVVYTADTCSTSSLTHRKSWYLLCCSRRVAAVHELEPTADQSPEEGRLSPENCLIRVTSRGREALVTDFGLAREVVEPPVKDPGRKLSLVGSAFWMAPEMLRGEPYDRKVYVFSFGIVLCEVLARISADPEMLPRTQDYGLDVEAFRQLVDDCPQRLLELAASCCMVESFRRPAFTELLDELEEVSESLEPPPSDATAS